MDIHRALDARWCGFVIDNSEHSLSKVACMQKKLLESMLFLLGLVRKNRNNLIMHRSMFEEWLNKHKINTSIEQIRQKY